MDNQEKMTLAVGMSDKESLAVTKDTVEQFIKLSGDTNPIHWDEEYAKKTRFGRCIAHGGIATALISKVLGNDLPGPGCVFLKQEFKYMRPVYIGDTITALVTIVDIIEDKRHVLLELNVQNQNQEDVISGTALMKII